MSRRLLVTVTETIHVQRTPEVVFDYTQDYAHRSDWDRGVIGAELLAREPRRIRLHVKGTGRFTVEYQLFRRPARTSAAFVDVSSSWMTGGGGSWDYERTATGTRWSQTNTLECKRIPGLVLVTPLIRRSLRQSMRRSMASAKAILEAATDTP